MLGQADLLAAVFGQAEIGDLEVFGGGGGAFGGSRHAVKGTGGDLTLGSLTPR